MSVAIPELPGAPAIAALLAAALLLPAAPAAAQVAGKEEAAVRAIFPDASRIEARDVLLTDEMVKRIEGLARARVKDRLVTFYAAHGPGGLSGYAVIHSHVVRTKPETIAIAFEPDGRIRKITVLAFLEPEEYRPSERWLAQFRGRGGSDRLAVGQDIAPITGATLTARGIAEESRWLLQALREAAPEVPR
ncbi:MAG TPA: FMN-binding protein [Anaeromyxobacter sp.]|nr:FMN-binding protein [Anaeromyxobacter sp.]